jgi:hypothetical protein
MEQSPETGAPGLQQAASNPCQAMPVLLNDTLHLNSVELNAMHATLVAIARNHLHVPRGANAICGKDTIERRAVQGSYLG